MEVIRVVLRVYNFDFCMYVFSLEVEGCCGIVLREYMRVHENLKPNQYLYGAM